MLTKNDRYKIVVGSDYLEKKLYTRHLKLGDDLRIEGQDFEIVGILKRSASVFGNEFIIMNDEPMREVLDIGDEVDLIAVKVQDADMVPLIAERIEKEMRKSRDVEEGKEDFSVETPEQVIETMGKILDYVTWFLVFIAMISLVVGGIGIMNTMFTSVLERRKEIGIMKSIGARNRNVLTLFLIESGVLGLAGGTIGILLGMGLSKSVEVIATLALGTQLIQAHYTLTWILIPLIFSFVIGTISGVMPAMQAANLKPVDALRQ
jgi:putative ABC transport system permease protein